MAPSLASWENGSCNNHILAGGRDVLETDLKPPLVNHKPKNHRPFGLPLVPFGTKLFSIPFFIPLFRLVRAFVRALC